MKTSPLARRYAKALFELSQEKQITDQILEEVNSFAELINENKNLRAFLLSPEIEKFKKLQVLEQLFKGKVSELFFHFLYLLVRKGRQYYYQQIVFEFARLYDILQQRIRVTITTAIELDSVQFDELERTLTKSMGCNLIMEQKVDQSILGGIIIQVDGKVIDGSLLHQLEKLKKGLKATKNI